MHLGFFIVFDVVHVFANSFVSDRVWPWHRASFGLHTRIFIPNFGFDNFQAFRLTLEQIVNGLYMPLGFSRFIFHSNDKVILSSRKKFDKIWLTIFGFDIDFI
jgi:hypothetical protein